MKGILMLSFIVWVCCCFGQKPDNDNKRFTFGVNFGKGNPVRGYGGVSPNRLPMSRILGQDTNNISGYAQLGFHYNFFASCKLTRRFSIMLSVSGNINSYDHNTLNSQYDPYFPSNKVEVFSQTDYHIMQYLVGPKINFPLSKNVSIQVKALVGLTTSKYPPSLIYFGVKDTVIYTYASGKGFGYNIGVGLKYNLEFDESPAGVGFHFNLSYAGANITYPGYSVDFSEYSTIYYYNVPKHMTLGIIQLTVGASLELLPVKRKEKQPF